MSSDSHTICVKLESLTVDGFVQAEERQAQEVRKLKRELDMAQDKINTLTSQLSTNVIPSSLHWLHIVMGHWRKNADERPGNTSPRIRSL